MSEFSSVSYPMLNFSAPSTTTTTTMAVESTARTPSAPEDTKAGRMCGRCSKEVATGVGRTFVTLTCAHMMHNQCFVLSVSDHKKTTECNEGFGGARFCAQCLGHAFGDGTDMFSARVDRAEILKYFHNGYTKKYYVRYDTKLADVELSQDEMRAILGIVTSRFSADKTDYSIFIGGANYESSAAVTQNLLQRKRTIDDIFACMAFKFNVQHLWRLGVRSKDDLKALGYNAFLHGSLAYRDKCPLWMVNEIFNIDDDDLFQSYTPDLLLSANFIPKELWLCGVTMQTLIDKNLSKDVFLCYVSKQDPIDVFVYMKLEPAHLTRLGVRRAELMNIWRLTDAKYEPLRAIVDSLA